MLPLLAILILAQDPDAEKVEAEAKAHVAKCKKQLKAADTEEAKAEVVAELASFDHPRVLAELKRLLGHKSEVVRRAVVDELGRKPDADRLKLLLGQLSKECGKAVYNKMGQPENHATARHIFKKLERFKLDSKAIRKIHGYFKHAVAPVACGAVQLVGALRDEGSVDTLIKLLRQLEKARPQRPVVQAKGAGYVKGSGGASGPAAFSAWYRKQQLPSAIGEALQKILGVYHPYADDYADHWKAEKKKRGGKKKR